MTEAVLAAAAAFAVGVIYLLFGIERAIREEGERTRRLIAQLLAETGTLDDDRRDPTIGDRVKWIQWRVNPKPHD